MILYAPTTKYPKYRLTFKVPSESTHDVWEPTTRSRADEAEARDLFAETEQWLSGLIHFLGSRITTVLVSTTFENEAIATLENEATQTDWMGDLSGRLGSDPAAGCGRCSAASGRAGSGGRSVDGGAGAGVGRATEVRAGDGADGVHAV